MKKKGEKRIRGARERGRLILGSHPGTPWISMGLISGGEFFKILAFLCFVRLSQGTFYASQKLNGSELEFDPTMFTFFVSADQLVITPTMAII